MADPQLMLVNVLPEAGFPLPVTAKEKGASAGRPFLIPITEADKRWDDHRSLIESVTVLRLAQRSIPRIGETS
ncbi:hypothetical protein [Rhizobium sp. 18055]|uniref:hypothetical protein n=1 Tax=Rhizobium sp. 18055 TaxID=2681403 RepID=UPI00135C30A8|nr:hypothetical protein [Rhizobium sp. 18055]